MPQLIKPIEIDCSRPNRSQTTVSKQGDINSRFLYVSLADNGNPIEITSENTVIVNYKRGDGEIDSFSGTVNEDGTVTIPLTSWLLDVSGNADCEIVIYDSTEQSRLSTTLFTLYVEPFITDDSEVAEDSKYDILLTLITQVDTAINSCETAASNANAATEAAAEAAETANVAAENADKKATLAQTAATNADTNAEVAQKAATAANNAASLAETKAKLADTAASNAQDITDTVTQKLENGEFNGPQGIQGIQGPPGEPGTTDYLKLLNKPIIDIDIAGITDFYFREQIPGSANSPCFYRIVSSDATVSQIQNVYIDENHKNEPVYEYLTVGDTFFVFDVFDNTSDGYQLSAFPLSKSDSIMQFLYLCTIGDEPVQKMYYAPLSTYEQLVQLITNLNDALNDLKTQEKLDIEQLQSQTEQKLSTKANKVSWRKIFEITTTEKVSAVEQSVDSNGKPFKLSQVRIIISIPSHSGIGEVAIDQPAVAYHPETDTDWYSLYGGSIGKSQAFLIFEIKAEPFVFGELTTMPNGSGFSNGSPLDKNTASVCCGGRYDIDYIDYFKLQDTLNADATFPANTKITMWGIDKND